VESFLLVFAGIMSHGAVTFDLGTVTLNLKFPSTLYLPNELRFFIGICWDDVLGDEGVSCGGIMVL
jgi:hypothetical protein